MKVTTTLIITIDILQSCWNCGRKASETCSGCNVARYCGSYCQHKDWENHHRVCGQGLASARIHEARHERGLDRGRPVDRQPPATTPVQQSQPPLQQITSTTGPQVSTTQVPSTQVPTTQSPLAQASSGTRPHAEKTKSPTPKTSPVPSPASPALSPSHSRTGSPAHSPAEHKDVSRWSSTFA
jgi:runt-related transcription factor 1